MGMKETTLARLRKIFNKKSEKHIKEKIPSPTENPSEKKEKREGSNEGKNGRADYPGAKKEFHSHDSLKEGDLCPECGKGKLYKWEPGIYIKVTGSPMLEATVHETEKFRCNACQKIFEANFEEKGKEKYDARACAIIALLKYSASLPFYRLEKIQKYLYLPLPASTQWDLLNSFASFLEAIWLGLIKYAANLEKIYFDDTKAKILNLVDCETKGGKKRKGISTTCIIGEEGSQKVYLYFTGIQHGSENLEDLLSFRIGEEAPIIISDALRSNFKKQEKEIIHALCNIHCRRKFIDLEEKFKQETQKVLDFFSDLYSNEQKTKEMSAQERLAYHQQHSKEPMDKMKEYLLGLIEKKLVEPNSSLGQGINYLKNHWEGLTKFLRIPGVPLDTNIVERAIKTPVLNKKNWLFYKTQRGALVGDIFLSLIKTAEANNKNPFDYLVALFEAKEDLSKNPEAYFPWAMNLK